MCFRPPQVGKPKRCPSCGAMNQYNLTHCKRCKAELPEGDVPMIKCPSCGKENRYDTDACDFCGMTAAEMIEAGLVIPQVNEEKLVGMRPPTAPGAPMAPGVPKAPTAPPGA